MTASDLKLRRAKFMRHGKLASVIAKHALGQGVVQVLAFIAGILLVRSMDKNDYAHYAIAVALVAATALVAEAGLNSVLMARGAKAQDRPDVLSSLFATAMRFRFIIGSPLIALGAIVIVVLLSANGMPVLGIALSTGIVIATLITTMTSATLLTFHRLNLSVGLIRRTNLCVTTLRLVAIAGLVAVSAISVPIILALSLFCALATTLVYKKFATRDLNLKAERSPSDWKAFKVGAKRTLPMNIMLVLSEQSILVFLSFLGSPEVIANVSALARFSIAFFVVNVIIADVGAPLIARTGARVSAVAKKFVLILGAYAALAGVLVLGVYLTAPALLGILGSKYQGLETPLLIIAIGSAVLNIGYAFSSMNQARGWTEYSWVYSPLIVIWAVIGLFTFDLSTTAGAALFMATQALPGLLTQVIRFGVGMKRLSDSSQTV